MKPTPEEIIDTLDDARLRGVPYRALATELSKRFDIDEGEAWEAIVAAEKDGVIVLDRSGAPTRTPSS